MSREGARFPAALLAHGAVAAVCAAVLATLFWPLGDWIEYPLVYDGDGLWNLFVIKTVVQTGWYGANPLLGAPVGAVLHDFAKPESLYLLLIRVAGQFTANIALIHNLFYFLGFFLVGASALAVLRDGFRLPWLLAAAGAIAYAFLPFHFWRQGHLFLSNYFVIPIAVWLALQLVSERPPFFEGGRLGWSRVVIWLAALLLASTSIYYAFFGIVLIAAVGMLEGLRVGRRDPVASAFVLAALVGSLVVANLAPALLHVAEHGANPQVTGRSLAEVDYYALRPVQLVLPPDSHRAPALAHWTRRYQANAPFINENRTAALGLLGSVGFMLLVVALLAGHRVMRTVPSFATAARINAVALALSVAGGGATLLGLLLIPQFRAMNRVSVVIAFVSVAALLIAVERGLSGLAPRTRRFSLPAAAALIALFALWDQVPQVMRPATEKIAAEFRSDGKFVRDIEKALPLGAGILQLPYIGFPEVAPLHAESPYSHLRGYLHGDRLRWNYGAMKGRDGDLWNRALATLPVAEQIDWARRSGFAGLWLERRAFRDSGAALERELRALGLQLGVESDDRALAFYPLGSAREAALVARPALLLGAGFYAWEEDGRDRWAWTNGDASLSVHGPTDLRRVRLTFELHSLVARSVDVVVGARTLETLALTPGSRRRAVLELPLSAGTAKVRLVTDMPPVVPPGGDPRRLAFAMSGVEVTPLAGASP